MHRSLFAQLDQTGNETKRTVDKTDYYYHAHDGMYFATVFTFAYESLSKHYENKGWIPPLIETRLGAYYLNVAGIYGTFAIGLGTGDIESTGPDNEDEEERDATYKDSFAVHSIGISFRITH